MQMRAIAVAVAAEWAAREPVKGVVAEGLIVACSAKRAGGRGVATGIARIGSRRRPGEPVLLVVAEHLVVGACGYHGGDGADVADRVVVDLLVVEHGPDVDRDQLIGHQPPVAVELAKIAVEGGAPCSGCLADVGADCGDSNPDIAGL